MGEKKLEPLTSDELRTLVELEKKATPAPWLSAPRTADCARIWSEYRASDGVHAAQSEMSAMLMWPVHPNEPAAEAAAVDVTFANAELIAALRNAAPRLFAEVLALREEKQKLDALLVMERTQARAALADTDHTARCKFRQHFDSEPCSCGKSVIERARALASFDAAALRMSDPGAFVPAPPAPEAPAG